MAIIPLQDGLGISPMPIPEPKPVAKGPHPDLTVIDVPQPAKNECIFKQFLDEYPGYYACYSPVLSILAEKNDVNESKKLIWTPSLLIRFLNTSWAPLFEFLVTHSDLISTKYPPYGPIELRILSNYLTALTPINIKFIQSELSLGPAFSFQYSQLTPTRQRLAEQKDLDLFLKYGRIKNVCLMFESHYSQQCGQYQQENCIADHLKASITSLDKDLTESGVLLKDYYAQNLLHVFPESSEYEAQLSRWAIKFEEHKIRIQTALALHSSFYLGSFGDIFIDRKITLAFSLFPELNPLSRGAMNQPTKYHLSGSRYVKFTSTKTIDLLDESRPSAKRKLRYKFNPSSPPSDLPGRLHTRTRTSSLSSEYVTAHGATSVSLTLPSLRNTDLCFTLDGVSSYSVASSRTADTDYGLFYRRMALSATSLISTITQNGTQSHLAFVQSDVRIRDPPLEVA